MSGFRGSLARTLAVIAVALACLSSRAKATGVPIGGFLPLVGIGLTDEFLDDFNTAAIPSPFPTGTLLGAGGSAYYDVALLDTGASVSLLTSQAFDNFGLGDPSPGESDGYRGTNVIGIGGATGTLQAEINDPLGLYVGGLQGRSATSPFAMNSSALVGQTNTSMITLPPESELPNVVGIPFASQYATSIRSDQPQIFTLDGRTVRTPKIEFFELGSGGHGISRRAPMSLKESASFAQAPSYIWNITNLDPDNPQEDPWAPTMLPGGLFLNVNLANSGSTLNNASFFFDTGADVTVLSELIALQLGIDAQLDAPDFTVAVVGSGGTKSDVPGYYLDTFTIQAIGGNVTATNVPVIVLDVADPSSPTNIVPGIVGTNLLSGRNLVIDPVPSLGGGGSPSLYISDPVTTQVNWTTTSQTGDWEEPSRWSSGSIPGPLSIVNVRPVVANSMPQNAFIYDDATVWEVNVSGLPSDPTLLQVRSGATLTTFAGINIEQGGEVQLKFGALDAQYVEILGGVLSGVGSIFTGSGSIAGQVENRSGAISPGFSTGVISIVGRFANGRDGTVNIDLAGTVAGTSYDQLLVDGAATLDGTLNVAYALSFAPKLGDMFSIIEATTIGGEFSTLNLPALSTGKMWFVGYEETAVTLKVTLPGDFNGNGSVDAEDLSIWKSGYGGHYSGGDFLSWQRYFGQSIPGAFAAVPEPAAGGLMLFAAAVLATACRRRSI